MAAKNPLDTDFRFRDAPACHGDAYLAYLRKKVPLRPAAGRTTLCQD